MPVCFEQKWLQFKCQYHLPSQYPMALFFVVGELALVPTIICIKENSLAMHLVVFELPGVTAAIGPIILATAIHFVIWEFTFVAWLVKHNKLA